MFTTRVVIRKEEDEKIAENKGFETLPSPAHRLLSLPKVGQNSIW